MARAKSETLYLPLKKEWYDMIDAGIKKEEYREIKPYWTTRLIHNYKFVVFSYGYTRKTMMFEVAKQTVGIGKPEWGAEPGKEYFIIELGKRIN